MINFPCAKINLGLNITEKRPTGITILKPFSSLFRYATLWKCRLWTKRFRLN